MAPKPQELSLEIGPTSIQAKGGRFCIAWGQGQEDILNILRKDAEIVLDYRREHPNHPYLALIECPTRLAAEIQASILGDNLAGEGTYTKEIGDYLLIYWLGGKTAARQMAV